MPNVETDDEGNTTKIGGNNEKEVINKQVGFHLLGKQVADWSGEKFRDVLQMEALEVFGIIYLMKQEARLRELNK